MPCWEVAIAGCCPPSPHRPGSGEAGKAGITLCPLTAAARLCSQAGARFTDTAADLPGSLSRAAPAVSPSKGAESSCLTSAQAHAGARRGVRAAADEARADLGAGGAHDAVQLLCPCPRNYCRRARCSGLLIRATLTSVSLQLVPLVLDDCGPRVVRPLFPEAGLPAGMSTPSSVFWAGPGVKAGCFSAVLVLGLMGSEERSPLSSPRRRGFVPWTRSRWPSACEQPGR